MSETRRVVDAIRRRIEGLDSLVRELHADSWNVNALRIEGLDSLVRELHADSWNVNALRAEAIQNVIVAEAARVQQLVGQLNDDAEGVARLRHEDLRALISQNHAEMWDANERRAMSLAEVVVLSITPRIEAMKQDLLALVGEKAVEVFREQSNGQ